MAIGHLLKKLIVHACAYVRTYGKASSQDIRILAQIASMMCGFCHGTDAQAERQDSESMAHMSIFNIRFCLPLTIGSGIDFCDSENRKNGVTSTFWVFAG